MPNILILEFIKLILVVLSIIGRRITLLLNDLLMLIIPADSSRHRRRHNHVANDTVRIIA